jgi:hypothetical protein
MATFWATFLWTIFSYFHLNKQFQTWFVAGIVSLKMVLCRCFGIFGLDNSFGYFFKHLGKFFTNLLIALDRLNHVDTALSITTFSIMTLSTKGLFLTLSINDTQHK